MYFMKTVRSLSFALAAFSFLAIAATTASADDCARLGGVINAVPECVISTAVIKSDTSPAGGPYTIAETLRITSTGKITIPQLTGSNINSLTLNITGGFIMEDGAKIIGDSGNTPNNSAAIAATITITAAGDITLGGDLGNGGSLISSQQLAGSCNAVGRGGNISLIATNGNITQDDGSKITTNTAKCSAGDILITATPTGSIDLDGLVLAQGLRSGDGSGKAGGGRITVIAGCNLTISDTGVLSSQGKDQGADLVHLEACEVVVHGLVESANVEGGGHADGVVNDNACNTNLAAHPQFGAGVIFTGCVEIWSGTTIVIDKSGGNNGEVSVDGVVQNSSWIDLFANGDVNIIGDTTGNFAVHGNPTGATNNFAALITIKSKNANVTASNLAVQADATGGGAHGGAVRIEAGGAVTLDTATISAQGDSNQTGGFGFGGKITVRSFSGNLSWQNGVGNVQPTGQDTLPPIDQIAPDAAHRGVITLQTCDANIPNTTGTSFPFLGNVNTNPVIQNVGACGGTPDIPVTLPPANCTELCSPPPPEEPCEKAAVRTVLNPLTGRFLNNDGPDVTVRLDLIGTPGNPTSIQEVLDTVFDSNNDGYIIVSIMKDGTGQLGGSRTESIAVTRAYEKRFALIGCSVTLKDANTGDGQSTALIANSASSPVGSPENIFTMDLHGSGSEAAGWKVEGDGRYLRNVATNKNAVGVLFAGNNNTMHNGNGNSNTGDGIRVEGSGNLVDSSDVFDNGGNGVTVTGDSNTIKKVDAGDKGKGNDGDGVNVNGNSNIISEVDAYSNTGNGINVAGNSNQLLKNGLGDKGKSNGLDGINLAGTGNLFKENEAYANGGNGIEASGAGNVFSKNTAGDRGDKANGLAGFLLSGGSSLVENKAIGNLGDGFHLLTNAFSLSKNVSGGTGSGYSNAGCQYRFDVAGNTNAGSNKSNNVTLAGNPFPAGCK